MPNLLSRIYKHNTSLSISAVVLVIKMCLFLWAGLTFDFHTYPQETWLSIWDRWDGRAYKTIAESGYVLTKNLKLDYWAFLSHFPPLYSLVMAVTSRLLGISLENAGILVSLLCAIGASIMLYKLVYLEWRDTRIAWFAVLFFNLYPISYFTLSVYSESLFIFLSIMSFYCLKKGWHLGAGLAAAAAILTRFVGVVFLPVYFLYFFFQWRKSKFQIKNLYPFLISAVGLGIYLFVNKIFFGNYFYFLTEKISFNNTKHFIFPFKETFNDAVAIFSNGHLLNQTFMTYSGWNAFFTVLAVVVTIWGARKMHWIYTAYAAFSILIFASLSWGISNARYTLSVFPIFMALGYSFAHGKKKFLLSGVLVISALGLLYFARIFTSGAWGF